MPHVPPVAYGTDGVHLVTADGRLVLVHDGGSEAPLFVHEMPGDVIALATDAGRVVGFDSGGHAVVLDSSGAVVQRLELGAEASAGAASQGKVAIAGATTAVFSGDARHDLHVGAASCVAFSRDGKRIAVGTDSGEVRIFDAATGTPERTVGLPGPARGLAFSVVHGFLVTTKGGIVQISTSGAVGVLCGTGDHGIGTLAVSVDGLFAAARVDDGRIILFEVVKNRPAGVITYERETGGVAFGPKGWLAVALDLGDGNKIDLDTGNVHRTDPHEGRPRNSWLVLADARGGGASARGSASPRRRLPDEPSFPESRGPSMTTVLGLIGVAVGLLILLLK